MTIRNWSENAGSRDQERLRLRDWLEMRIGMQIYPGLVWESKVERTFRIPWKHGARHGWRESEDARLFRDWSEHTGASPKDVKQHKANFRCALNSLRDVRAVPQLSKSKGDDAYRVYRMLPKQKTKSSRVWIRKRGKRHAGSSRRSTAVKIESTDIQPNVVSPPISPHFSNIQLDSSSFAEKVDLKMNFFSPEFEYDMSALHDEGAWRHSHHHQFESLEDNAIDSHSMSFQSAQNPPDTVSKALQATSNVMDEVGHPIYPPTPPYLANDKPFDFYTFDPNYGTCNMDLHEKESYKAFESPHISIQLPQDSKPHEEFNVKFLGGAPRNNSYEDGCSKTTWDFAKNFADCHHENEGRFLPWLQESPVSINSFDYSDSGQTNVTEHDVISSKLGEMFQLSDSMETSGDQTPRKLPSASTLLSQPQLKGHGGIPRIESLGIEGSIDFIIPSTITPERVYESCY